VRRVEQFLWDRDAETVRGGAFGIAVVAYSILVVATSAQTGDIHPVVQVLLAAVSLAGIVALVEGAARRLRTRAVRGIWMYRSSSSNWGLAEISGRRNGLYYSVQLFADEESLLACYRGEGTNWHSFLGHTESTFVEFSERQLHIRYEVNYTGPQYPSRAGFLVLQPIGREGYDRMVGYWTSTTASDGTSSGRLMFVRPPADGTGPTMLDPGEEPVGGDRSDGDRGSDR
jgi:hypothetical protein